MISKLTFESYKGGDLVLDGSSILTLHRLLIDGQPIYGSDRPVGICITPAHALVLDGSLLKGDSFLIEAEVSFSPRENRALFG